MTSPMAGLAAGDPALRARVELVIGHWTAEAQRRREVSKTDPVSDTLEHCASKLKLALDDDALTELTTADYARLHHRTEQTVRRWCRLGLIASRKQGAGYLIQRGTRPPTFGGVRRAS